MFIKRLEVLRIFFNDDFTNLIDKLNDEIALNHLNNIIDIKDNNLFLSSVFLKTKQDILHFYKELFRKLDINLLNQNSVYKIYTDIYNLFYSDIIEYLLENECFTLYLNDDVIYLKSCLNDKNPWNNSNINILIINKFVDILVNIIIKEGYNYKTFLNGVFKYDVNIIEKDKLIIFEEINNIVYEYCDLYQDIKNEIINLFNLYFQRNYIQNQIINNYYDNNINNKTKDKNLKKQLMQVNFDIQNEIHKILYKYIEKKHLKNKSKKNNKNNLINIMDDTLFQQFNDIEDDINNG